MNQTILFKQVADYISSVQMRHPIRVAIDGVGASGKTTIVDKLVPYIEAKGRTVIQASVDGFHRPREERYRQGPDSPKGYYEDSFDYGAIIESILIPLGPNGNRQCRLAIFNFRTDTWVNDTVVQVPNDAILLFEGVFLLRPELNDYWDVRIFVDTDFSITTDRGAARDTDQFGSREAARKKYEERYVPGEKIYLESVHPQDIAEIVIDNNALHDPQLTKFP